MRLLLQIIFSYNVLKLKSSNIRHGGAAIVVFPSFMSCIGVPRELQMTYQMHSDIIHSLATDLSTLQQQKIIYMTVAAAATR